MEKERRKVRVNPLLVTANITGILCLICCIATLFIMITGNKPEEPEEEVMMSLEPGRTYTAEEVESMVAEAKIEGGEEGKEEIKENIKDAYMNGTGIVHELRLLFPDDIVFYNNGKYQFVPISNTIPARTYDPAGLVANERGEMEYPQYDVFAREADAARIKSNGLSVVRQRIEELRFLGEEKDFTPWLIEESPYKGTYGDEASANQQSAALVAMLTVVLLLAGSFAYETQSGMNYPLASTMRGRKALLRRKIGMAAILTTVIWAVTYGLEFHAFLGICDTGTFVASVQNLSLLEKLPIRCSIGVFLVGLYLLRWVALFTCAMLTMLISSFMKRLETAYISACGVMLLPSLLYLYFGLEPMKYLSLVLLVEATPIIQNMQSFVNVFAVLGMVVTIFGVTSLTLRKKMRI